MTKLTVNMVSESDITVQGHGVHTAYVEMASALEKRSDIEVIRGEFGKSVDCDVIHFHTVGPKIWSKLRQKGPKKVISAHIVPASFIGSLVLAKYWRFIARWYLGWVYRRADKVLAVSKMVADSLRQELHVPATKIDILHNTVAMSDYVATPDDRQRARQKFGIGTNEFVVFGAGQVQPRKRLDTFVAMANELPHVQFIWAGGIPFKRLGAEYAAMQQLLENVPRNMTITGIIEHNEIKEYLAAADVFCLPAEQENHPMCVLEAAGAGLPIVLRDIPEYDDTFKHDAIRCRDGDFTSAMTRLQNDTAYYRQAQRGAQIIATRFDSGAAADRLVQLYNELV